MTLNASNDPSLLVTAIVWDGVVRPWYAVKVSVPGFTVSMGGAVTVTSTVRTAVTKGDLVPLYCTVTVALACPTGRDAALAVRTNSLPSKFEIVSQV